MSEPFLGEIRMFAGNFAPAGWARCDGQLLNIAQNTALFSLFGTIYGGNGQTSFGLPDLRGRIPVHAGNGPGLPPRPIGQKSGAETVALTVASMPTHSHSMVGTSAPARLHSPAGARPATNRAGVYTAAAPNTALATGSVSDAGSGTPHENMQPFLTVTFIVAMVGLYPSMG